jgi:hypothetical protein
MRKLRIVVLAMALTVLTGLGLSQTASSQDTGQTVPVGTPTPALTPIPSTYPVTPTGTPTPALTPIPPTFPVTPTVPPTPAPGAKVPLPNVKDSPPAIPKVDNRHPRGALRPMDINYYVGEAMIGGPFKHGSAMTIAIWTHWSKKHQTIINSDCAGTLAEVGYMPKYELRNFGRWRTGTTACRSSRYHWQRLKSRPQFHAQRMLKRGALNRGRRLFGRVHNRAKKAEMQKPKAERRHVPRVPRHSQRAVDGNKNRTVLVYDCLGKRSHTKMKLITLNSAGDLRFDWCDGSAMSFHHVPLLSLKT